MKKTTGKKIKRAFLILAGLLALILLLAPLWLRAVLLNPRVAHRIKIKIETAVSDSLQTPVDLGRVRFDLWGRVRADGLRLGEGKNAILQGGEVTVTLSWPRLLKNPGAPESAVRDIRVKNPELFLRRDEKGMWNYPRPKPQPRRAGPVFPKLEIHIQNADLRFRDDFATPTLYIRDAAVHDLSATLNLYHSGRLTLSADSSNSTLCERLHATLDYHTANGLSAGGTCFGANPDVARQAGDLYHVTLNGPAMDVDWMAGVRYRGAGNAPDLSLSATLHLKDYEVILPDYDLHFTDTAGGVTYANGRVRFQGVTTRFAGGDLALEGIVTLGKPPQLLVRADMKNVDISKAGSWLRELLGKDPRGVINGWAFVTGSMQNPRVAADASIATPRWSGYSAERVQGLISYGGGVLDVTRAHVVYQGTKTQTSGFIRLSEDNTVDAYSLMLRFQDTTLQDINSMAPGINLPDIRGTVSGHVLAARSAEDKQPLYYGSLTGRDVGYATVENMEAYAAFSSMDGRLFVDNFAATGDAGFVAASGVVEANGALDITIDSARATLKTVLGFVQRDDVAATGALNIAGKISGTTRQPDFTGTVRSGPVSLASFAVDHVEGGVGYKGGNITLTNVALAAGRGQHSVSGVFAANGSRLDLDATLGHADLAQFVDAATRLAGAAQPEIPGLGGVLSAQAHISGSAKNPAFTASVQVVDLTGYGEHASSAEAGLRYDGALHLDKGLLSTPKSRVSFSGVITKKNQLDFQFSTHNFHVPDLKAAASRDVSGVLNVNGTVSGTWKDPVIQASVDSPEIALRALSFQLKSSPVSYQKGIVTFGKAALTRGPEEYYIAGAYDTGSKNLDVQAAFLKASPQVVESYLERPLPRGTSGSFEGTVHVISAGKSLSAEISLRGKDASIGTYPLTTVSLDGTYLGNTFNLKEFRAVNDTSQYTAYGVVDLDHPMQSLVHLDAVQVDLAMLAKVGLTPPHVSGLMDVNVNVVKENGHSYMAGSLYAYNLAIYDVGFDQSRGLFEFNGRTLTITQLQFIRDQQRIIVRGDIPITTPENRKPEHPLQIVLSSKDFELATLNPLLQQYGVELSGALELRDLVFKGSTDSPALGGSAVLSGVTLKHRDLDQPVEKINGMLLASGGQIILQDVAGVLSGKKLALEGAFDFKGLKPSYILELHDVDNLAVGYRDIYKGRIDIKNLRLKGDMQGVAIEPLQGSTAITLHDGVFTLVPLGEKAAAATSTYDITIPGGDLVVTAGEDFTARTPGKTLSIQPAGSLRVSGNVAAPQLKGYFTATEGYVRLPVVGIRFKLTEEAVVGFYTLEGIGLVPFLKAKATARTGGMDLTMDISGPLIDLNQYPDYQRMCAAETSGPTVGLLPTALRSATAVPIGGGYTAPVCPTFSFSGTDQDGNAITNDQVFNRLTGTDREGDNQTLSQFAENQLFSYGIGFGSEFITEKSPIDDFELSLDPNKDIFIQLEKCVAHKFCLRYERLFSQQEQTQIDVLYKFRKRSYLLWGIDEENQSTFEIEYRLNF